jgi:hypothetical protein
MMVEANPPSKKTKIIETTTGYQYDWNSVLGVEFPPVV